MKNVPLVVVAALALAGSTLLGFGCSGGSAGGGSGGAGGRAGSAGVHGGAGTGGPGGGAGRPGQVIGGSGATSGGLGGETTGAAGNASPGTAGVGGSSTAGRGGTSMLGGAAGGLGGGTPGGNAGTAAGGRAAGGSTAGAAGTSSALAGAPGTAGSPGVGGTSGTVACAPPPPDAVGTVFGDPHLMTFDGVRYDFQAVGELTLARDTIDGTEVQIRTKPWGTRTDVAITVAVAVHVGSDTFAFYNDGTIRKNHVVSTFVEGKNTFTSGTLCRSGAVYVIVWSDNTQLRIDTSHEYLGLRFYLAAHRAGEMSGLLGTFDGTTSNELFTRLGASVVTPVPFETFYGTYAESWRIMQGASLFDYGGSETTETFTDRTFPHQLAVTSALPSGTLASAASTCQGAGVTASWLDACELDVGLTGDARFANGPASEPAPRASIDILPPVSGTGGAGGSAGGGGSGVAGAGGGGMAGAGGGGGLVVAIPGLFPTGVDANGAGLPSNSADPHYAILNPAQSAVVIDPGNGSWVANTTGHRWVWQTSGGTPTNVTLTFRTTFSLNGLSPTTASISGSWATDNTGVDILLNGHSLGLTSAGFSSQTAFSIAAGSAFFVTGTNTLDFTVNDGGVVAGFMVGSLQGTAMSATP